MKHQSEEKKNNVIIITERIQRGENLSPKKQIPNDFLYWSILNLLLMSVIFGTIALVYSILVRNKIRKNSFEAAAKFSKMAFRFNLIGSIFVIVNWIIITVVVVVPLINNYYAQTKDNIF
jgi:hypothetical protein